MRFWRNKEKGKLPSLDISELGTIFRLPFALMGLKDGQYSVLPVASGLLVLIKDQGLLWLPYSEIDKMFKELELKSLAKIIFPTAIASAVYLIYLPLGIAYGTFSKIRKIKPTKTIFSIPKSLVKRVELLSPEVYLKNTLKDSIKIKVPVIDDDSGKDTDARVIENVEDKVWTEIAGLRLVDKFLEPDVQLASGVLKSLKKRLKEEEKVLKEEGVDNEMVSSGSSTKNYITQVVDSILSLPKSRINTDNFLLRPFYNVSSNSAVFRIAHTKALDLFLQALTQEGYVIVEKTKADEEEEKEDLQT